MRVVAFVFVLACMANFLSAQTRPTFNRDVQQVITKTAFDSLIDRSILLLNTKPLTEIGDTGHIGIMMCLNTIMMAHDTGFSQRFKGSRYERLEKLTEQKNYVRDIITVYPEWIPNRGLGEYFPKLQMELYGTPMLYAWFDVTD